MNELEKKSTKWTIEKDLPKIDLKDDSVSSLIGDEISTEDSSSSLLDACDLLEDDVFLDEFIQSNIYKELFQVKYEAESEDDTTVALWKDDFAMETTT